MRRKFLTTELNRLILFLVSFLFYSTIFSHELFFQEEWKKKNQLLFKEVREELEPLFSRHLKQHLVDENYLMRARDRFIEELDPAKSYFLAQELEPYTGATQSFFLAWQARSLEPFWNLFVDRLQATLRAEKLRQSVLPYIKEHEREYRRIIDIGLTVSFFARDDEELVVRQSALLLSRIKHSDSLSLKRWSVTVQENEEELEKQEAQWKEASLSFEKASSLFQALLMKALSYALDPHSAVLGKKEAEALRTELTKMAYGTGLRVVKKKNYAVVTHIFKHSPAEQSGRIHEGDRIVSINAVAVDMLGQEKIEEILEEREGEKKVCLLIEPQTSSLERHTCILTKKSFPLDEGRLSWSIRTTKEGAVLVVKLDAFYRGSQNVSAERDLRRAWQEANQLTPIQGLVLDIRKNPGGFLLEAVRCAGLFIRSGVVVVVEYADGTRRAFRDLDPERLVSCPTVILVSKKTASAAEIMAQTLKDYGVALIIGDEKTYGKGTVQTQTVTRGEKSTSRQYKVTVGEYYSVGGKPIQAEGVTSDIVVPQSKASSSEGEEQLEGSLPSLQEIEPCFQDTLQDVSLASLFWYRTYYLPFIQEPEDIWKTNLPMVRSQSALRVQGRMLSEGEQLDESVLIVEDMIALEKSKKSQEEVAGNCKTQ